MKKSLIILALLTLLLPAYSEQIDKGGHAGTPPGFYDDIDPNTLENEDKEIAPTINRQPVNIQGLPLDSEGFGVYSENNDFASNNN